MSTRIKFLAYFLGFSGAAVLSFLCRKAVSCGQITVKETNPMSKKKIVSIVLSIALAVLAALIGCVFGVDVDFSSVDISGDESVVEVVETGCSEITRGQP